MEVTGLNLSEAPAPVRGGWLVGVETRFWQPLAGEELVLREVWLGSQRKAWGRIERSRKQLLSRRREGLLCLPSASDHLPAAVKRAI